MAEMPSLPSFPKPLTFLVGGITLATILSVLAAMHRDRTDQRLRSPEMIQDLTPSPVLAYVPLVKRRRLALSHQPPLANALSQMQIPSMLQEAVRRLYAQISLTGFGRGSERTLLVTSSDAREGKTFVALGIAQFAAASGKRVLLIECDLRKPSLQATLEIDEPQTYGLTDYLSARIDDVPLNHSSKHRGLDIIVAGQPSIASTELLNSPRFEKIIEFATRYDLVLLDSPPWGLLMDASVIAPRVDGVLFCARWGRAEPDRIAAGLKSLQTVGGKIVGLVVTFTPNLGPVYGVDAVYQRRLA
jgi:succinoglycan biosynthesis transport protein ExoP